MIREHLVNTIVCQREIYCGLFDIMREFSGERTHATLLNQPFLAKVCDGKYVPNALGLFAFCHCDTTIADLHFELGIVDAPLESSSLLYLLTQHLADNRSAGILSLMTQIFYATSLTIGRVRSLVCLLICATFASTGQAQTFELDNEHTSLVFAVSHSGLSYTYGRFNKCSGQITIGEEEEDQSFLFTIDAKSIDTNSRLRDDHLKGPEFFDVRAFPKIEFRSVKLSNEGDDFTAEGTLEMHGAKKDITIQMTKIGIGKGPRGKTRVGFFSKFSVKRSDFDIRSLPTIIGDQIAITLSFEGVLIPKKREQSEVEIEGSLRQGGSLQEEFGVLEQ